MLRSNQNSDWCHLKIGKQWRLNGWTAKTPNVSRFFATNRLIAKRIKEPMEWLWGYRSTTHTHIQPQISNTTRGDSQTYPLDPSGNQTLYNEKSSIDSWCSYNKNKQLKWMFSCHACLPEGIQQCQPIDESTALSLVASNWQGAPRTRPKIKHVQQDVKRFDETWWIRIKVAATKQQRSVTQGKNFIISKGIQVNNVEL